MAFTVAYVAMHTGIKATTRNGPPMTAKKKATKKQATATNINKPRARADSAAEVAFTEMPGSAATNPDKLAFRKKKYVAHIPNKAGNKYRPIPFSKHAKDNREVTKPAAIQRRDRFRAGHKSVVPSLDERTSEISTTSSDIALIPR
jgi:hypothetical protein